MNDTSNDEDMTSLMHVLIREYKKNMDLDPSSKTGNDATFSTDTLGNFSCQILAVIAHYPAMQERIKNEIDVVIGDRQVEADIMGRCPYTIATVLEVLRNCAVAKAPHLTLEDTTSGGYDIPLPALVF